MKEEEMRLLKGMMVTFWSCHNNDYTSAATKLFMQQIGFSPRDIQEVMDMNEYDDEITWNDILEEIEWVDIEGGAKMTEEFTVTMEQLAWCPVCGDSMELQVQKDLTAKELYLCFGCDQLYLFTKVEEDKK